MTFFELNSGHGHRDAARRVVVVAAHIVALRPWRYELRTGERHEDVPVYDTGMGTQITLTGGQVEDVVEEIDELVALLTLAGGA